MLYIVTALVLFTSGAYSRTLCSRIFFQNMDETNMPYKFNIEGVFIKQSYNHNNFPVYKRENGKILFYLSKETNGEFLIFGLTLGLYYGAGAETKSSAVSWLATGILDKSDVFGSLISYWLYYNYRDKINYKVTVPPYIKAVCVDNDFIECNSQRVYLNSNFTDGNNKVLNDMNVDYFYRISTFRNLRPVYRHNRQNWYLQYTSDNYWLVTTTQIPTNHNDKGALMRVNDYAGRPEFIKNIWSIYYKSWTSKPDLKVMCRGVRSQANTCSPNQCSNSATCIYTSGNETVCACLSGYYGLQCTETKTCLAPQATTGEIGFPNQGSSIPGDLAMTFCRSSNPSWRYAICVNNYPSLYWSKQGTACTDVVTTQRPFLITQWSSWSSNWPKPTPTPINFDDMPGLSIAILACAIQLQLLLPFILWCCAICKTSYKEKNERKEDQQRREEFEEHLESQLETVRHAQNQAELDQGVQNYQHEVQEYQQETETTEMKRKKGIYRNASLLRFCSMDYYISFYLWLIYFLSCTATQCSQYGSICNHLNIMATIMLIICPLFVFVESFFSHELSYIRNIMMDDTAWGYIQKMQAVAPVILMTVECYHWETRSRIVYYTDANGNTRTGTETYEERVVTYVECDEFHYGCWIDISKREMPSLSSVALTRLKIDSHILFGDRETEEDFERQRQEILEKNRHRDVFMDFSSNQSIPGLKERIAAYVDLSVKPWWISQGYFWLATFLQLTWPYRWLFRAKTAKTYYDLKKKIYKSTSPPPEVDIMDPVAILQQASSHVVPGRSNVNPSFAMTQLPSGAAKASPPLHPLKAW